MQDLPRINDAIASGSIKSSEVLRSLIQALKQSGGTCHLVGLVSPGGVHSHEDHAAALAVILSDNGVPSVVHVLTDGRDTPPKSALDSLKRLQAALPSSVQVATVIGRYYAMDRDKRWDRVKLAYDAVAGADAEFRAPSALAALDLAYARGENDEFVRPTIVGNGSRVADGDAIVFMNFRADRARELSHAFVDADFSGFARAHAVKLAAFVTLTEYEKGLAATAIAYSAQSMQNSLGEYLASLGLTQLRIAETEKYAHVTFFFSGGREAPFAGEERILVPSPHVATYDLKPEMSCPEVTDKLVEAIASKQFDVIVCNLANADMVGHTGIEAAGIKAAEAIDVALGRLSAAILAAGGEMLITADHGNLEQMLDANGVAHTQHTVGPVPLVYVGRKAKLERGSLRDIAPTVLALMNIPQPAEMTGRNLVEFTA
jgi:2,3-bisphosphoglycerate-independent phosphoglycerate mutase